jgi:DNA-3-methyladenine glycosylase
MNKHKLPKEFYLHNDVVDVAKQLLGKELVVCHDKKNVKSGIITETEAYAGVADKASHAYGNKRTQRTATMFQSGGIAYVYLCYGIHHLFNVVTNTENQPDAVLIRSILPLEDTTDFSVSQLLKMGNGPGKVSRLLGITKQHNGIDLCGDNMFVVNRNLKIHNEMITTTSRVGIDYAGEDALLPYRFIIKKEYIKQLIEIQ